MNMKLAGTQEDAEFVTQARTLLGDANVLTADLAAYATDWRGKFTGMCGGATPDASGQQVVLSLSRLNRVRNIAP